VGDGKVRIDQLQCKGDSIEVRYEGTEASLTLTADGSRLPVLEATFDAETGAGSVVAYPVLKTQSAVTVSIKGAEPVDVALP
jgi:hypothetical protein